MIKNQNLYTAVKEPLLNVLAELVTLPLPQQAMVHADLIGIVVGALMEHKGMTQEQSLRWTLDRMEATIKRVRPH